MRKFLKGFALLLLGLLSLVLLLVVYFNLNSPLDRRYQVEPAAITIPTDAAAVERGRHLAEAVGVCMVCHGQNLGGQLMVDDPALGYIHTPNLTTGRGGIGHDYSQTDWVRAIRHGVAPDGRGLIFMPVDYYYNLTDADLGALIAYLQSVPLVDNEEPALRLNPLTRTIIGLGLFGQVVRAEEIDHTGPRPQPLDDEGAYLLAVAGCTFCHGENLTGGQGPEPGAPPAPDLTRAGNLGQWSFDDFVMTLRQGSPPDGRVINPNFMPWVGYSNMTDGELRAIWDYLQAIPIAGNS